MDPVLFCFILGIALLLIIVVYKGGKKEKYDGNPAVDTCMKYCPLSNYNCYHICDNWVSYLSSGLRFPCPGFLPEAECKRFARF